jgi:hypothetical protein
MLGSTDGSAVVWGNSEGLGPENVAWKDLGGN